MASNFISPTIKVECDLIDESPQVITTCRRSLLPAFLPPAKKIKLDKKSTNNVETRVNIIKFENCKLEYLKHSYYDNITEHCFLLNGGNIVDLQLWIKKSPPELLEYLKSYKLFGDLSFEQNYPQIRHISSHVNLNHNEQDSPRLAGMPRTDRNDNIATGRNRNPLKVEIKIVGHQDQIVEKAKQEVSILQRISILRKDGLWGEKRLPKVQEPSRPKAHWDYLLEEMVWLSADFAQERKWKKAAAKKCAKMVQKYFQDKTLLQHKAHKEQEIKLRKTASFVAKEIKLFWNNIQKIIEYKINTRLDEKKKRALDQHLNFIVDQTEKYSTMLAESMKRTTINPSSVNSEASQSSDEEFIPNELSDDDEATIGKEDDNQEEQTSELKLLEAESKKTLDDILSFLPKEYFASQEDQSDGSDVDKSSMDIDPDEEFIASEIIEDDEKTINMQEQVQQSDNYEQQLENENIMTIDALKATRLASESHLENMEVDEPVDLMEDTSTTAGNDSSIYDLESTILSDDEDFGLEELVDNSFEDDCREKCEKATDEELEDATAVAESLQPKGFTLSSTSVTTPVPFLLKHTLREYQHVGLDWLVTMYEKDLNGILADEMGLGKTIQTIALLAHLACENKNWGPHLIIVPTSVMLNWEMEIKKWCPAFKILTYYGTQKERRLKRQGWTKQNAFHICITSYKLVIQDHQSFRRKKWCYFILDEAQNIKNFKSQRWQLLLNFQSQRRLLLTGTPLQNNLMELWSLMHFLRSDLFSSHRDFKELFSNPVTKMIEGNKEYNDTIIKKLHKVLRPFILRRLKCEVEQQMPKKFEHIIMCRLSKRQRFLYEEFMSRTKTKETLSSGNFMSVINILMQLRKVCNHPNLFEARPIISPFMMGGISYECPSLIWGLCEYNPFKHINLFSLNLMLSHLEKCLTAFAAHRMRRFQVPKKLIEEIDSIPEQPPKCPAGRIRLHVRPSSQPILRGGTAAPGQRSTAAPMLTLKTVNQQPTAANCNNIVTSQATSQYPTGVRFQLVQYGGSYKAIPLPPGSTGGVVMQSTPQGPRFVVPHKQLSVATTAPLSASSTALGGSVSVANNISTAASTAMSGGLGSLQLVQTSVGNYLLTSTPIQKSVNNSTTSSVGVSSNTAMALLQRLQSLKGLQGSVITTGAGGRPVLRLPTSPLRPTSVGNPLTAVPVSIATTKVSTALQALQQNTHVKLSSPIPQSTLTYSNVGAPSLSLVNKQHIKDNQIDESKSKVEGSRSIFYMSELEEAKRMRRKEKLKFLAKHNTRHCHACPIYGGDLIEAVSILLSGRSDNGVADINGIRNVSGLTHSQFGTYPSAEQYWTHTSGLKNIVNTPLQRLDACRDILDRFVFCVPSVLCPQPQLHLHHPCPSKLWKENTLKSTLQVFLTKMMKPLHSISCATVTQFPEPRLIQYDCGKLQKLNVLLRTLKMGAHRVLIFTQMTKMLDVFETFLNYHGHLYLRMDGTTKVEQRQILMERFNQDQRIFVFILSTRSGGIGVNLTGADTVIFYDSDWNPTMDAQAQDRCHRIGQTRDVHIYRLISERTVEENILKKANQKKLLGDLAIEGGNFTTVQLKKQTIHDLFKVDLQEQDASKRMSDLISSAKEGADEGTKMGAYESALAAAEDESDVQAAKTAKAEVAAHLAEFDENIPLDENESEEGSKVENELSKLMKQLNPIEKYAMKFLENSDVGLTAEAERISSEIEQQKKEWEQNRLTVVNENQQRLKNDSGDEQLTYSSVDARNKVWLSFGNEQVMGIWHPLTPPRNDNDRYMEEKQDQLYESTPMEESSLPSIYVTRETKRIKLDPDAISSSLENTLRMKVQRRNDDLSSMPRSMFDTPTSLMYNKGEKIQMITRTHISTAKLLAKITEAEAAKGGGFLDLFTANVVSMVDTMINNSMISSYCPTNWDLVADVANISSFVYRSSRSTRSRYDAILALNDDQDVTEQSSKKIWKRTKSICMRSNSVGIVDNNGRFSKFVINRFVIVREVAMKAICSKPVFLNSNSKNKHASILHDYGLNYDEPVTPKMAAAKRAERLKKLEQKNELLNRSTVSSTQTQSTSHQHLESSTVNIAGFTNKQVSNLVSQGDTTTIPSGSSCPNLPISSSVTTGATVLSNVRATVTGHVQAGQGGRTTVTFQDIQGRTSTSQATVVSVGSLSQLEAAKLAGPLSTQNVHQKGVAVPVQARALTPQQMQLLRQQAQKQTIALQSTKVVSTSTTADGQTIKRVQIASQSGANQKLQVAVSGGSMPGITAIQVSQAGRAQLIKSGSVVAALSGTSASATMGKNLARSVTESEMNAILRRTPHHITKAGNIAQMIAKQRPLVNMKGATVGLIGNKTGVAPGTLGTVQIVQGPSTSKHMTVQQLQQAIKQGAISGTIIGKAVVSSANCIPAGCQTTGIVQATLSSATTKIIPMSVSPQTQNIKQTIQVVSAGTSASTSNSVKVTGSDRSSGLALQANTVRVANSAILSQVSTTLQQGPLSVSLKSPGTNPIRIESTQAPNPQDGSNQQQFNQ